MVIRERGKLPPRVYDSLIRSFDLSAPFRSQVATEFPGSVDKTAEKMQTNIKINEAIFDFL